MFPTKVFNKYALTKYNWFKWLILLYVFRIKHTEIKLIEEWFVLCVCVCVHIFRMFIDIKFHCFGNLYLRLFKFKNKQLNSIWGLWIDQFIFITLVIVRGKILLNTLHHTWTSTSCVARDNQTGSETLECINQRLVGSIKTPTTNTTRKRRAQFESSPLMTHITVSYLEWRVRAVSVLSSEK